MTPGGGNFIGTREPDDRHNKENKPTDLDVTRMHIQVTRGSYSYRTSEASSQSKSLPRLYRRLKTNFRPPGNLILTAVTIEYPENSNPT